MSDADPDPQPYIPDDARLPELTFRAIVLGLVLSVILCAANMYVGLYAGMTVSAAIPASVISMAVLRGILRRGTILENNVVHTIASAGESLSAGIIFTVPALILLGVWKEFHYWETTFIALAGGLLGAVLMIPLRRPMIIDQKELKFPEGVACAEVLKAGDRGGAAMTGIFSALGIGAAFKLLQSVGGIFSGTVEHALRVRKTAFYAGTDISPMLMAVGFIVGHEVTVVIVLGGLISFVGALPVLAWGADFTTGTPLEVLWDVWDTRIRYFGIGAMVVAGVASIIKILPDMGVALRMAVAGLRKDGANDLRPRTDQDISGKLLIGALAVSLSLCGAVFLAMTGDAVTTAITMVVMMVLAFFFVAVASYIAGLVGSSNSPVSGMTICTVLVTAGLLIALGYTGEAGMLATLGVAGVVCCAACTSGDICQDLKIGQIVGATPKRLQTGEIIGTILPAFIVAPVLTLLHSSYGIVEPAHPEDNVPALKAPQAAMFEKLVKGLFGKPEDLPWDLIGYGALVGATAMIVDRVVLEKRGSRFRLYGMPLAVGMYLPLTVSVPMIFGSLALRFVERRTSQGGASERERQDAVHRGLLFASGIVAGEAICGVVVAVLLVSGFQGTLLTGLFEALRTSAMIQDTVTSVAVPLASLAGFTLVEIIENTVTNVAVPLASLAGLAFIVWLLIRVSLRVPGSDRAGTDEER
jgi:putative OPT family oligopeptide transporter